MLVRLHGLQVNVAHRFGNSEGVAALLHRIGAVSVPSRIRHQLLVQAGTLSGSLKSLCNGREVSRLRTRGRKYPSFLPSSAPSLEHSLYAFAHRHEPPCLF